jgi:hypothetical protein
LAGILAGLPAFVLTDEGASRVAHGQDVASPQSLVPSPFVRLLNERGDLLAIAEPTGAGLLHPSVVLV